MARPSHPLGGVPSPRPRVLPPVPRPGLPAPFAALLALCLAGGILLCLIPSASAGSGTCEDLIAEMRRSEALAEEARTLWESLRAEVPGSVSVLDLWRRAGEGTADPRSRAVAALGLVGALFPEGDPARYGEVSGLILPQEVPVPLMAADAVFLGADALSRMGDPAAGALAMDLLARLARSDPARYRYFRIAPEDLAAIRERIAASGCPRPVGFPTSLEVRGRLPFARPAIGTILNDTALSLGMTFLDGAGRPGGAGGGTYAWDRRTGRILHVRTAREDRRFWVCP